MSMRRVTRRALGRRHRRDRGQAVVLVLAAVVLVVLCAMGVARLGVRVLVRQRAQAAADAAALAGAANGREAAVLVARANGAQVRSFVVLAGDGVGVGPEGAVEVVVVMGGEVAVARAARAP